MACKFTCDGCGKEAPAVSNGIDWIKPKDWFQRGDRDDIQDACSRDCIKVIAEKSGKTNIVLPF